MTMKLISIEDCQDCMTGFIDDGDVYRSFTLRENNELRFNRDYPKERYADYDTFATIFGKFDPYVFFLKEPVEIDDLTFENLREAIKRIGEASEAAE